MACQSQRGLPLCPTNDHISSISASASPARSTSQATLAGFNVRSTAVFTDSSTASFFLSGKLGQICTDFEVKHRKSARIIGIDHSKPEETPPHLISFS